MKAKLQWVVWVLGLVLLSACQTTNTDSAGYGLDSNDEILDVLTELDRRNLALGESTRLNSGDRIGDWHAINDSSLILSASATRHYLITLAAPCRGLRNPRTIAMDISGSTLAPGDWLMPVTNMNTPIRCRIEDINLLVDQPQENEP